MASITLDGNNETITSAAVASANTRMLGGTPLSMKIIYRLPAIYDSTSRMAQSLPVDMLFGALDRIDLMNSIISVQIDGR